MPSFLLVGELIFVGLGVTAAIAWAVLLGRLALGVSFLKLPNTVAPSSRATVVAIVPMRNEEKNAAGCLRSLLNQEQVVDVVAVDDNSSDGTNDLLSRVAAEEGRVRVVRIERLPENWAGKSYACVVGSEHAPEADWFLFVDADTRLAPGALGKIVSYAERNRLDAISLLGRLRCPGLWDELATPFYFGLLNALFSMKDVNDPNKESGYFVGSFVLIRRTKYLEIGGHTSLASQLVEDKALGKLAKEKGLSVALEFAPDEVTTEWAPGLRNGVDALVRVIAPPMRGRVGVGALSALALSILLLMPILVTLVGAYWAATGYIGGTLTLVLGVVVLALEASFALLSSTRFGKGSLPSTLGFVPASLVFTFALWVSVGRSWRGMPVLWRGREYRL